jgi:hypothetical protein
VISSRPCVATVRVFKCGVHAGVEGGVGEYLFDVVGDKYLWAIRILNKICLANNRVPPPLGVLNSSHPVVSHLILSHLTSSYLEMKLDAASGMRWDEMG